MTLRIGENLKNRILRHENLALGFLLLFACLIRFIWLDSYSVWFDEMASFKESQSLNQIFTDRNNGVFYLVALNFWRRSFGDSLFSMRALSLLPGVLSVGLVWGITRKLFSRCDASTIACGLFLLLPNPIFQSREARMYSMWVFFFLFAFFHMLDFRKFPVSHKSVFFYLLGNCIGLLCHTYMFFYSIGLAVGAYFLLGEDLFRKQRREILFFLKVHSVIWLLEALLFLRLTLTIKNLSAYLNEYFWRNNGSFLRSKPFESLANLFFRSAYDPMESSTSLLVGGALVLICLFALQSLMVTVHRRSALVLMAAGGIPYLVIALSPIRNNPRLFSPSVPIFCVLLAGAIVFTSEARRRAAFGLSATALLVYGFLQYPRLYSTKEDPWNWVCGKIQADGARKLLVLVNEPQLTGLIKKCNVPSALVFGFPTASLNIETILRKAQASEVTWMVYSHSWFTDLKRKAVQEMVTSSHFTQSAFWAGPEVQIYRFEKKPEDK